MKFLDHTSTFVGYNPQMMPPPMGPNQGNYGPSGGKMPGNMPGPMNQGYPQYNSHYPQGKYTLYKKNHFKLLLLLLVFKLVELIRIKKIYCNLFKRESST